MLADRLGESVRVRIFVHHLEFPPDSKRVWNERVGNIRVEVRNWRLFSLEKGMVTVVRMRLRCCPILVDGEVGQVVAVVLALFQNGLRVHSKLVQLFLHNLLVGLQAVGVHVASRHMHVRLHTPAFRHLHKLQGSFGVDFQGPIQAHIEINGSSQMNDNLVNNECRAVNVSEAVKVI